LSFAEHRWTIGTMRSNDEFYDVTWSAYERTVDQYKDSIRCDESRGEIEEYRDRTGSGSSPASVTIIPSGFPSETKLDVSNVQAVGGNTSVPDAVRETGYKIVCGTRTDLTPDVSNLDEAILNEEIPVGPDPDQLEGSRVTKFGDSTQTVTWKLRR